MKIPAGRYRCIRTIYQAHSYETFEITGVLGHDRLLIHIANEETDVDGCVGIGRRYGLLRGCPAVLDSCGGFADFMRLVGDRPSFDLLVRGPS